MKRCCRLGKLVLVLLAGALCLPLGAQAGQGHAVYHTNREFIAVNTTVTGQPTVFKLLNVSTQLTEIVGPGNVITNMDESQAIEKEAVSWGYTNAAIDAWTDVHDAYPGNIREHPLGTIYDNVGFLAGTRRAYGKWGAYLWLLQNKIVFQTSSNNMWYSSNSVPNVIQQVVVGTIGDFAPTQKVVDVGPLESDGVGAYPGGAWGMWNGGSTDVVYTADFTAYYSVTGIQARITADVNENGQFDEADWPLKTEVGSAGLLLGVNNNTHETATGDEVDWADEEINGEEDKQDMKLLWVNLDPSLGMGSVVLRCDKSESVRIFTTAGEPVIGPEQGGAYEIPALSIPSAGLFFWTEALESAQAVKLTVCYRGANGVESGWDMLKIATFGMSVVDGYAVGSLSIMKARPVKSNGKDTDRWYAFTELLGANNPAYVMIRLLPGDTPDCQIIPDVNQGLLNGTYVLCDEAGNVGTHFLAQDSAFWTLVSEIQAWWQGWYDLIVVEWGISEEVFVEWIQWPYPTPEIVYNYVLTVTGIQEADVQYTWQLPAVNSAGEHAFKIKRADGVVENKPIKVVVLQIDLLADTDRVNEITDDDDEYEDTFTKYRGAVVLANRNNDGQLTDPFRWDCDDFIVNGPDDLQDMAKIIVRKIGISAMPANYKVRLRIPENEGNVTRIFNAYNNSAVELLGPVNGSLKEGYYYVDITDTIIGANHEYAVESLNFIGEDGFDGTNHIDLVLQEDDWQGNPIDTIFIDRIVLQTVPIVLDWNGQNAEKIFTSRYTETDNSFEQCIRQALPQQVEVQGYLLFQPAIPPLHLNFVQDYAELAHCYIKKNGSLISKSVLIDLKHEYGNDGGFVASLRAEYNYGYVSVPYDGNGGDIETVPSIDSEYPLGRVMIGDKPEYANSTTNFNARTLSFLAAQRVQPPIILQTKDFMVGHVDEQIAFIKKQGGAYAILAASPRKAINMLHVYYVQSNTAYGVRCGYRDNDKGEISIENLLIDSYDNRPQVTRLNIDIEDNTDGEIDIILMEPIWIEYEKSMLRIGDEYFIATSLEQHQERVFVNQFSVKRISYLASQQVHHINDLVYITSSLVKENLDKMKIYINTLGAQRIIDANVASVLGGHVVERIDLPVLFESTGQKYIAITANYVNSLITHGKMFSTREGREGNAYFDDEVLQLMSNIGIQVIFVPEAWERLHMQDGEVHCGSNARRVPNTEEWWNAWR